MFGKKKPIKDEVFGEMIYWTTEWRSKSKIELTLWNNTYKIDLCAVAGAEKEGISEIQRNAYKHFKETIIEQQKEIEKLVSDYYQTQDEQVLAEKFTPMDLQISLKGECAIIASNADDEDIHDVQPGLAVVVYPKKGIYAGEDYAGYIFGSGSL